MVYTPRVGGCGCSVGYTNASIGDRVRFTDEELFEENGVGYIKAVFLGGGVTIAFRHEQLGANTSELILLTKADPPKEGE
jgi:hypothetical protein